MENTTRVDLGAEAEVVTGNSPTLVQQICIGRRVGGRRRRHCRRGEAMDIDVRLSRNTGYERGSVASRKEAIVFQSHELFYIAVK